jgi:hypothetical protein
MFNILRTLCALSMVFMATNASAASNAAVVVVYPLTITASGDPGVGKQIASLIAQQLSQAGSVEIREPSPDVARPDYLETARRLGADYFLSGFVTKVSGQLSVVEQLVSTLSNTTVWSNNAHLLTTDDARTQGDLVRAAVIGHSGRGRSVANATAGVQPTAPAKSGATQATAASAAAQVVPPASRASKASYAVLLTGGPASRSMRSHADTAIIKALRGRGAEAVLLDDPVGDLSVLGPALCASTGEKVLLGGTVGLQIMPDREINQWAEAKIELTAYDCAKHVKHESCSGDGATYNWTWAVDQAVDGAVKAVAREEEEVGMRQSRTPACGVSWL